MIKFDLITAGPFFCKGCALVRQGLMVLLLALSLGSYAEQPSKTCKAALEPGLTFDANGKPNLIKSSLVTWLGKKFFKLGKLEQAAERLLADKSQDPYFIRLARSLQLDIEADRSLLDHIPEENPLVIMSNHTNATDGIALAALASAKRKNVKVVLNQELLGVPEMSENAIGVDTSGKNKMANLQAFKEMIRHIQSGGTLIIFPSGELAQKQGEWIIDPEWQEGILDVLKRAKNKNVSILNAFIEGAPSSAYLQARKLWNVADHLKKNEKRGAGFAQTIAETATGIMNIREIGSKAGSTIKLTFGSPISYSIIEEMQDNKKAIDYLRIRSLLLKKDQPQLTPQRILEPIAEQMHSNAELYQEMSEKMLVMKDSAPDNPDKGVKVFFAKGGRIPKTLQEIGRLREITFREVGEGTSKSRDLDDYDQYYYHLVAYDKNKKQIMGAYRVGMLKEIMRTRGAESVYSAQFFRFSQDMIDQLEKSIELGRSFVKKEYQRRSLALPMLLQGVAQLFIENPEYENLLGPVSISNEFGTHSKKAIIKFLNEHYRHPGTLAIAVNPPKLSTPITEKEWDLLFKIHGVTDFKSLNALVATLEKSPDRKIPPLLEIYTKFGVEFIDFNFDADFNSVDGLILTHLSKQPLSVLAPYFGSTETARYYLDYPR